MLLGCIIGVLMFICSFYCALGYWLCVSGFVCAWWFGTLGLCLPYV